VNGIELLQALEAKSGIYNDYEILTSVKEIQETFSNYFRKGAAVERPFVDGEVYQHIVEKAGKLEDHQVVAMIIISAYGSIQCIVVHVIVSTVSDFGLESNETISCDSSEFLTRFLKKTIPGTQDNIYPYL
jgi:hypothetical protein